MATKTIEEKCEKAEYAIVEQATKIVHMRRKRALWRELEPELSKLGRLVASLEALEEKLK